MALFGTKKMFISASLGKPFSVIVQLTTIVSLGWNVVNGMGAVTLYVPKRLEIEEAYWTRKAGWKVIENDQ